MTDLNTMHLPTGSEYEVFEPENAWAGAPARIVVQVNRFAGGTYQLGYDPESGLHWYRTYAGTWGEWTDFVAEPPPPEADAESARKKKADPNTPSQETEDDDDDDDGDEASDEYKTTDMRPKRGPGRPRKS
jgi:hypothetical protein